MYVGLSKPYTMGLHCTTAVYLVQRSYLYRSFVTT